jgi:uncharacterized protein (DUF1684 family)
MLPLHDYRAARLAALTGPDGWLNLVARIDLAPGRHLVGAAQELQLPSGPDLLGTLDLTTTGATFARPGEPPQPFQPAPDAFPQLRVDPFLLEIHTVDNVPALRVRDLTQRPTITLRYFPDNSDWIVRAKWERLAPEAAEVTMKDGSTAAVTLTHRATFQHQGKTVTLTPTHWKSGKPMFVFRDRTAGETYPACRFLFGEDPTESGITLDFNRAISPPCAFTDFAICPLPPPGNILPFRIEAGELAP